MMNEIPNTMSGSRTRPTYARLLGLLALLIIPLLAACEDEASPVPTQTPTSEATVVSTAAPTQAPTPEPTATPTAEPTPTPSPTPEPTVTVADVEAVFAGDDATWRELFDILGAAEQACIRERVGENLDETLDAYLNDATGEQAAILRCLPPDLADSVFIVGLISELDLDEFGIDRQVTTEERRCLEDLVEPLDTAALMETLATDASSAEAAAFAGRVYKCIPDVLIALVIWNAGVPVAMEDMDDDALECMREAVQGISDSLALAVVGQEGELSEESFAFLRTIYGCAPDIFGPGLTGTPTPVPTPTPAPGAAEAAGRIAFVSDRDGNWDVYVMNADGSDVTRLTDAAAWDQWPSWSPDGMRIAFHSDRDESWDIYAMNADGSDVTRLTDDTASDLGPSWSPDGRRIAFYSDRDGDFEIYVMDADGSGVTRLTDSPEPDWHPSWSPDGGRIAFVSERDGDFEIYVMNADGSDVTRLTDDTATDSSPSWSPDGRRIAFASDRDGDFEIYVMNADGSDVTQLTDDTASDLGPSWSPDGQRIAFMSSRDGDWDVYVMNADGSGVTSLTDNRATTDWYPSWSPAATPTPEPTPTATVRPTQSGDNGDWTYFGPECPDGYPNCAPGRPTSRPSISLSSYGVAPAELLLLCSFGSNELLFAYEIDEPAAGLIFNPLGMHIGEGERMEFVFERFGANLLTVVFDGETSAEIIRLLLEAESNDLLLTVVASTRVGDVLSNFDITGLAVNVARLPCGLS